MTDLKKTVEEQIDIILRLEDERKGLLKQNRILKDKIKELSTTLTKYSLPKPAPPTNQIKTSSAVAECQTMLVDFIDAYMQTEQQVNHLEEAKSLLKLIDSSKDTLSMSVMPKENDSRMMNTVNEVSVATKSRKGVEPNNEQLLEQEIIRLTKQANILRRENKQCVSQLKGRDKEIKELKKVLELKNEHLEKTKRQFSQLSILVNTDKFKSVRLLQEDMNKLRVQNKQLAEDNKKSRSDYQTSAGISDKLKFMLENLTEQYERYKREKESQQEGSRKRMSDMQNLVDKYKEQAWTYERNEKYLTESLRQCQERLASNQE